jgi:hypothetical protein
MTRFSAFGFALALTVGATACGGGSSDGTIAPTPPLLPTESFSGVVQPGAGNIDSHTFTVTQTGSVSVTLLTAGPPATIQMGLGLGTPGASGTCSLISSANTVTAAGSTAQLPLTNVPAGTYCVAVVDVGNALGPISYTLTVSHT